MKEIENEPLLNQSEEEMEKIEELKINETIRKGFIVKVYSLLLIQLALTFGFVILGNEIKVISFFIVKHALLYIIILFIPLIIMIFFICKPEKTKQVPLNYILLFLFTISEAYTLTLFTLEFQKKYIYFSMLLTLIAVLTLTIYASKTKKDFTLLGGTLCVFLVLLIIGQIFNLFFRIKFLYLIFNIIGICLFSIYIIYDTQLIIGNKERKISEDYYILAVIILYLDIIILFMDILSAFGKKNKK